MTLNGKKQTAEHFRELLASVRAQGEPYNPKIYGSFVAKITETEVKVINNALNMDKQIEIEEKELEDMSDIIDFLQHRFDHKYDNVITNPPEVSWVESTTKIKQNKQLTLNEYQLKASETAIYPKGSVKDNELPWMYPVLLLPSEVGELLSHFQKAFRDKNGELTNVELIKKELGDILWSISEIARQLGLSLEDVAITNIEKLQSRKERGKIGGSGDKR